MVEDILVFLLGYMVAKLVTICKVNKLMNQLEKVSHVGTAMFQSGVKYAMDQIGKVF